MADELIFRDKLRQENSLFNIIRWGVHVETPDLSIRAKDISKIGMNKKNGNRDKDGKKYGPRGGRTYFQIRILLGFALNTEKLPSTLA